MQNLNKLFESTSHISPNLKSWIGKSVLIDKNGIPIPFYHGTMADISEFSLDFIGGGHDQYGSGFYFTDSPEIADMYTGDIKTGAVAPNILKVYLRIERPIYPDVIRPLPPAMIAKLIELAPDSEESLMNYGDIEYEGYQKVLRTAVKSYANATVFETMNYIHNDFYGDDHAAFLANFKKITKYDGVIIKDKNATIAVVFDPSQIKSAIGNIGTFSKKSNAITESPMRKLINIVTGG